MTEAIEIVRAGLLTSIQDRGRPGLGRWGISPSGAMDPLALALANRMVGNDAGAAALEITGPGTELRFVAPLTFAVAGGDLGAVVDGAALAPFSLFSAQAGQTLRFERRVRGARGVVAVAGGLIAELIFGSASTDLDAGFGTHLRSGARLAVYSKSGSPRPLDDAAKAVVAASYYDLFSLRFVPEADPDLEAALALFSSSAFRISPRSNRTGYRLEGPALPAATLRERLSEPNAPGIIQLPPAGQPTMLMADRGSVGGYPRLGHVIRADRPKAAQLFPGDTVRFVPVTLAEAQAAIRTQAWAFR